MDNETRLARTVYLDLRSIIEEGEPVSSRVFILKREMEHILGDLAEEMWRQYVMAHSKKLRATKDIPHIREKHILRDGEIVTLSSWFITDNGLYLFWVKDTEGRLYTIDGAFLQAVEENQ